MRREPPDDDAPARAVRRRGDRATGEQAQPKPPGRCSEGRCHGGRCRRHNGQRQRQQQDAPLADPVERPPPQHRRRTIPTIGADAKTDAAGRLKPSACSRGIGRRRRWPSTLSPLRPTVTWPGSPSGGRPDTVPMLTARSTPFRRVWSATCGNPLVRQIWFPNAVPTSGTFISQCRTPRAVCAFAFPSNGTIGWPNATRDDCHPRRGGFAAIEGESGAENGPQDRREHPLAPDIHRSLPGSRRRAGPRPDPRHQVICIGKNYAAHAAEIFPKLPRTRSSS